MNLMNVFQAGDIVYDRMRLAVYVVESIKGDYVIVRRNQADWMGKMILADRLDLLMRPDVTRRG